MKCIIINPIPELIDFVVDYSFSGYKVQYIIIYNNNI